MLGIGSLLGGIGSLVGGLFGGGDGGSPSRTESVSGWQALPKELQEAYLKSYLPDVLSYYKSGPNEYEKQLQDIYAGGLSGLTKDLPGYLDVFKSNVTDPTLAEMQRQADIQKNRLNAQAANNGLGGLLNSNLGVQLSELQANSDRMKNQYLHDTNRQNLNSALDLRTQMMGELSNAGNQKYNQLTKLAGLLGAFPGGSTSTAIGGTAPRANTWDKVGGALTTLGGMYNQYNQSQYADTPWLYNGYGMY